MPSLKKMFGAQVRHFRNEAKLTQTELAERIEVTPEMVGKIERGVSGASFKTIDKLSIALDIPANALFPSVSTRLDLRSPLDELILKITNLSDAEIQWADTLLTTALGKPDQ